jgi:hypothetical protein
MTDAAEEGGLKMMWSCCIEGLGRKESSGLIFRLCLVLRAEDSCRRAVVLRARRHCLFPEHRSIKGRLISLASIAEGEFVEESSLIGTAPMQIKSHNFLEC